MQNTCWCWFLVLSYVSGVLHNQFAHRFNCNCDKIEYFFDKLEKSFRKQLLREYTGSRLSRCLVITCEFIYLSTFTLVWHKTYEWQDIYQLSTRSTRNKRKSSTNSLLDSHIYAQTIEVKDSKSIFWKCFVPRK